MAQYLSFNLIHYVYKNADMQNHVYLTTTQKLCLVDKCKGDLYNNVSVTSIKCLAFTTIKNFLNLKYIYILKWFRQNIHLA